jgi:phage repressor protein C with HTH and peptisase S24 domain
MISPGEKIAKARASRFPAWSQADLAKATDLSRSLIAQWEAGNRAPKRESLEKVATALGIPLAWFEDGQPGDPPPQGEATLEPAGTAQGFARTAVIRSYRGVLAGYGSEECWFEEDGWDEVPTAFLVDGARGIDEHGIARVSGRSMEPRIHSGDRVVVRWNTTLIPNSIVLARDPSGRMYLKVLREKGERGFCLESLSSHGDSFLNLDGWTIQGYAVAILADEDREGPNVEWRAGKALKALPRGAQPPERP